MSILFDESSYMQYFLAMSPIIIGHLAIPPLKYLRRTIPLPETAGPLFEAIYAILGPRIINSSFVESLILEPSSCLVGTEKQWLTHMFVHDDFDHLLGNLSSAIQLGYPVYMEFGAVGIYFVFIFGGIFAVIPSHFYEQQSDLLAKVIKYKLNSDSWPASISRYWNSSLDKVFGFAAKKIPSKYCGSSGAVYSLMGCEMVFLMRDCYLFIRNTLRVMKARDEAQKRLRDEQSRRICDYDNRSNSDLNKPFIDRFIEAAVSQPNKRYFLEHTFNLAMSVFYLYQEYDSLNGPIVSAKNLKKKIDMALINHAGHVQGALFGIAFSVIFGIVVPNLLDKRPTGSQ